MPKKDEGNQRNRNSTSFTKCYSEQNRKINIAELFLNYGRKGFHKFEEYISIIEKLGDNQIRSSINLQIEHELLKQRW